MKLLSQHCPDIWQAAAIVYQYCPDIFQEELRKATKTSTMIMSSIMIIVFWAVSVEIHCCGNTSCPFLQGTIMYLKSHTVLHEFFTSSSMLQYCTQGSIRQNTKQTHHFVEA
jgi:hypothetical protein